MASLGAKANQSIAASSELCICSHDQDSYVPVSATTQSLLDALGNNWLRLRRPHIPSNYSNYVSTLWPCVPNTPWQEEHVVLFLDLQSRNQTKSRTVAHLFPRFGDSVGSGKHRHVRNTRFLVCGIHRNLCGPQTLPSQCLARI